MSLKKKPSRVNKMALRTRALPQAWQPKVKERADFLQAVLWPPYTRHSGNICTCHVYGNVHTCMHAHTQVNTQPMTWVPNISVSSFRSPATLHFESLASPPGGPLQSPGYSDLHSVLVLLGLASPDMCHVPLRACSQWMRSSRKRNVRFRMKGELLKEKQWLRMQPHA